MTTADIDTLLRDALADFGRGAMDAAERALRQAVGDPRGDRADAWTLLGMVEKRLGRPAAAEAAYRKAIALMPEYFDAWQNLGNLLAESGRREEAAALHAKAMNLRLDQAVRLHGAGDVAAALRLYEQAERTGGGSPPLWRNMANAFNLTGRLEDALAYYRRALDAGLDDAVAGVHMAHVAQKLCAWDALADLRRRVVEPALAWQGDWLGPPPFPFLAMPCEISGAEHLKLARRYAKGMAAGVTPLPAARPERRAVLKVGYLSADYHDHATAHLMRGFFRRQDRRRFEVCAYSLGRDDGSEYRKGIERDCDRFVDLAGLGDAEAAQRIRADGIDILVDLKGYTTDSRPRILAYRPAPVQATYLGYPGTMGADFIDYVLTDRIVTPPQVQDEYSERFVYLPHSYQVNDDEQPIGPAPARADCGLAAEAFVFCCFNAHFKIDPFVFSLWMEILHAVPGSVLWLIDGQPRARRNLQEAAAARGIAPERLVFAPRKGKPDHLARHAHADLFLDTRYYTAHTTASDALWAGVPVLSCPGHGFASRVSASLLTAVGMPELIVPDWQAYRDTAVALAGDRARLAGIKAKLAANRLKMPLFDTARFVRDFEDCLGWMQEDALQKCGKKSRRTKGKAK